MIEKHKTLIPRLLDGFVTHSYIFAFILLFVFLFVVFRAWQSGLLDRERRLWVLSWIILYLSLIYFSSRYFSVAIENDQLKKEATEAKWQQ